ncbi:MAG TPA: Tn3 family transposase, partial [Gaiellales bacterium]|nr:Tn3 family transposase [Gaiellales bacterium]
MKTLHVLEYVHDPAYRRTIHHMVSRGERRNSLARDVFHGQRGQLRKHYQVGQTALEYLAANGYPLDPDDVARLTPSA